MNDIVPEVIARDIILLIRLKEFAIQYDIKDVERNEKSRKIAPSVLFASGLYTLWFGYNMPAPIHQQFLETLDKLIQISQNYETFSKDPFTNWLNLVNPTEMLPVLNKIWQYWRNDKTPLPTVIQFLAERFKGNEIKDPLDIANEAIEHGLPNSLAMIGKRATEAELDAKFASLLPPEFQQEYYNLASLEEKQAYFTEMTTRGMMLQSGECKGKSKKAYRKILTMKSRF